MKKIAVEENEIKEKLAKNISHLIYEKSVSVEQMSKNTDISVSAINSYRSGQKLPGAEAIIKMAIYFGVSADSLLSLNEINTRGRRAVKALAEIIDLLDVEITIKTKENKVKLIFEDDEELCKIIQRLYLSKNCSSERQNVISCEYSVNKGKMGKIFEYKE